jgi:hypothetical protein
VRPISCMPRISRLVGSVAAAACVAAMAALPASAATVHQHVAASRQAVVVDGTTTCATMFLWSYATGMPAEFNGYLVFYNQEFASPPLCLVSTTSGGGGDNIFIDGTISCFELLKSPRVIGTTGSCNGSAEVWHIINLSNGTFEIQSKANKACLQAQGVTISDIDFATYSPCQGVSGTANDQFYWESFS